MLQIIGPSIHVDPNKAIAAPYSQGNELVFGCLQPT